MNAVGNREYEYIITHHARERFVERFSEESRKFAHLSKCRNTTCETCRELTFSLTELVQQNKGRWDGIICAKLHAARDVRIFQNNQRFMDCMYERYGVANRFRFLVESNIVFVIVEVEGGKVVRTCMDVNYPINGSFCIANLVNRPKYTKRVS